MPDKWVSFGPDGSQVEQRPLTDAERAARNYVTFTPAGAAPSRQGRRPSGGTWAIIIICSAFVLVVAASLLVAAQMNSVSLFVSSDALNGLNSQPTSTPAVPTSDAGYVADQCRAASEQHLSVDASLREACAAIGIQVP